MESLDLYTIDRGRIGRAIARGQKLPEGAYRLVVHVCVFNGAGQMLIQQRAAQKDYGNLWDVTLGGGVRAGEDSRQGASRELWEELGIAHDFNGERPFLTIHFDEGEDRGFDDYYAFRAEVDLAELRLQPEEVQAVRWASREEVLAMVADGRFASFYPGFIEALFDLWDKHSVFRD